MPPKSLPMPKERFYPDADRLVKIITNGALILSLLLVYDVVHKGPDRTTIGRACFIPIVIAAWYFHPRYYSLDTCGLRISRPVGSILIPYKQIKFAGYIAREDLGNYIRLFACSGLFGYFGLYSSKKAGRFSMWCTNKKNMVAITRTDDKVIILSPPDPDAFIDHINSYLNAFPQ